MTKCKLTRAVRTALYTGLAATALGLTACGGSGSSSGDGTLSLGLTDAPVDDANKVVVEFSSVTLKPANGEPVKISFDEPQSIDLLAQQNGNSELLLENEEVSAGNYNWVRLGVNLDGTVADGSEDTFIKLDDGSKQDLDIPSGAQTGLKLVSGFFVANGGSLDLTIDFDLRKSVVESDGNYKLRPALRLVNNAEAGEIAVEATTEFTGDRCPDKAEPYAAYIYEGSDVQADDVDGNEVNPVTTVSLEQSEGEETFTGVAGFLDAGDYTAAFTCSPEADDPEVDDDISFSDSENVTVEAGETAQYNLKLNN